MQSDICIKNYKRTIMNTKSMKKLQILLLPSSVVFGIILSSLIWHIALSIYAEQASAINRFLWQQVNLNTLLLLILPILAISIIMFQYHSLTISMKNIIMLILLSCVLSLLLSLLMMGLTFGVFEISGGMPPEILLWLSSYFIPFLGLLIKPLFVPLCIWFAIYLGFPFKHGPSIMPLSHGVRLFLIFCLVAFLFYIMIIMSRQTLMLSSFQIQTTLAILAGCFIYDRIQYDKFYKETKFTQLNLIIVTVLLVIAMLVSISVANYILQVYSGKYIANLIIQTFINGFLMVFLTQLCVRKILYRI